MSLIHEMRRYISMAVLPLHYLDLKGRRGEQTQILSHSLSRFIDKVWHAIFRITGILLNALHKLYLTQSNNFRNIRRSFGK